MTTDRPLLKRPILIFDLGGVLIDFTGYDAMYDLLDRTVDKEEIRRCWGMSPALMQFERGQLSPEKFAEAFVAEWDLPLTPKDFLNAFTTWVTAPYAGTQALLNGLAQHHTLAVLSNTNALHWTYLRDQHGLGPLFEYLFLSFEMGLAKPHAETYEHVIATLGTAPGDIWFFDDNDANVDAAIACGMHSVRVRGLGELKTALDTIPQAI